MQTGSYDGSGLGQGGDGVGIFLSVDATVELGELIDSETFPDADLFGGQSWDVPLGAFSTVGNASGAVATTELNDASQPAIGSPGSIPEPASFALLGLGSALLIGRRRRRKA